LGKFEGLADFSNPLVDGHVLNVAEKTSLDKGICQQDEGCQSLQSCV
jgi:hypothetical protein